MKFFHVYNEKCFKGLEKNGLLNKDSGFKIQHAFSVPEPYKFHNIAAKEGVLFRLLKEMNAPFYVDRIAGGITYYPYRFDERLIDTYKNLLGDWFLGFQLHESGSNRRVDWARILTKMDGQEGPYEEGQFLKLFQSTYARLEDGTLLSSFIQDSPEQYAKMRYAKRPDEFLKEMRDMFQRRMAEVSGKILPCDSYYLATKIQDEMGMKTFMPEVGCQITMMRMAVALARGMAKAAKKTWGTYYECWRQSLEGDSYMYSMPCFNKDSSNEWYLTQETHPDDFTSYGEKGGSSRLLQNRIYYYALMSGADYFSEEWGLNCSYTDMETFSLSPYGKVKKDFIDRALTLQGMHARIPFAIVLPKKYSCVELPSPLAECKVGIHRERYMECVLSREEQKYYGHIEDVLKLFFAREEEIGNEGHVITNSRFGDVFDMIYEDASDQVLETYEYLIDASPEGTFARTKAGSKHKVLESGDLCKLEAAVSELIHKVMPCYVDALCWLVSEDEQEQQYLSIFNNEGNERSLERGDILHAEADRTVTVVWKQSTELRVVECSAGVEINKADDTHYRIRVPAAGFSVLKITG